MGTHSNVHDRRWNDLSDEASRLFNKLDELLTKSSVFAEKVDRLVLIHGGDNTAIAAQIFDVEEPNEIQIECVWELRKASTAAMNLASMADARAELRLF